MRVIFTKHAKKRFRDFAKVGVRFSRKDVLSVLKDPEHLDDESNPPKIIASKPIDEKHVLRVVFKVERDIITVITFYPARRGRYYEA